MTAHSRLALSLGLIALLIPARAFAQSLEFVSRDREMEQLCADIDAQSQNTPPNFIGTNRRSERLEVFGDLFTPDQLSFLTTSSNVADTVRAGRSSDPGATSSAAYASALSTSLVYGIGPDADSWPVFSSWAAHKDGLGHSLGQQILPMSLDFTRRHPFFDSEGGFSSSFYWFEKVLVIMPSPHGSRSVVFGGQALRVGTLEFIASDRYTRQATVGSPDTLRFCTFWLKRAVGVAMTDALSSLLTPRYTSARAARARPQFPATLNFSY
jgi:hypothetical protein